MKHTLRVLTVLLLSSTSVLAQGTCGQTQCPTTYKNLYCYDAGSKNKGRVQFKAKICLVGGGRSNLVTGRFNRNGRNGRHMG
jgi:hypothetical protein